MTSRARRLVLGMYGGLAAWQLVGEGPLPIKCGAYRFVTRAKGLVAGPYTDIPTVVDSERILERCTLDRGHQGEHDLDAGIVMEHWPSLYDLLVRT